MLGNGLANFREHRAEVGVAVEEQHRSLGVPPAQVRKQLVERRQERFLTFPEFTFRDENVAVLYANQDVGLSRKLNVSPVAWP